VSVERASIALLLGDSARAMELLGAESAQPSGQRRSANAEVMAFVKVCVCGLVWLVVLF